MKKETKKPGRKLDKVQATGKEKERKKKKQVEASMQVGKERQLLELSLTIRSLSV